MADMLQFLMGKYSGLAGQAITPGRVYVTTDEEAMYVDIPAKDGAEAKRIRLSDVIQVEDTAELMAMAPNYSKKALYYVIKKNALMKYMGDDTDPKWQQINSVKAVEDYIKAVENKVTTLEETINGTENSDGLVTKVAALRSELDTAGTGIKALLAQAGDDIDALEAELNTAETGIKAQLAAVKSKADTNATNHTNLANTVTTVSEKADANATAINTLKTETIPAINTAATTLKGRVDTIDDDLNKATTGLKAVVGQHTTDISDIKAAATTLSNTVKDEKDKLAQLITDVRALDDKTASSKGRVTVLEESMATLQGTVGTEQSKLTALTEKVQGTDAEGGKGGLVGSFTALEGTVSSQGRQIETIEDDIEQIGTDIDAINEALGLSDGTTGNSVGARLTVIEETLNGNGKEGAEKVPGLVADMTAAQGAITSLQNELNAKNTGIKAQIATIKGVNTAQDETLEAIGGILAGIGGDEDAHKTVVSYVGGVQTALETKIAKDINAANAMDFKGGVIALPSNANVKVGDTYVATQSFEIQKDEDEDKVIVYPGDLLIASGTEDASTGYIPSNEVVWTHVKTGYVEEHQPKITGDDNKISLTSYVGKNKELVGDLGEIEFAGAANSNVTVAVAGDKVTIGMEWGTF